jgi:hypothetical protein
MMNRQDAKHVLAVSFSYRGSTWNNNNLSLSALNLSSSNGR